MSTQDQVAANVEVGMNRTAGTMGVMGPASVPTSDYLDNLGVVQSSVAELNRQLCGAIFDRGCLLRWGFGSIKDRDAVLAAAKKDRLILGLTIETLAEALRYAKVARAEHDKLIARLRELAAAEKAIKTDSDATAVNPAVEPEPEVEVDLPAPELEAPAPAPAPAPYAINL